jgi:tetratricopeptide (TPR) repeat protein
MRKFFLLILYTVLSVTTNAGNDIAEWGVIQTTIPAERNIIISAQQLYKSNKIYEAIALLKKTVKQQSGFYDAHFYLGFFYQEIQNHKKAVIHFSTAIRIKENNKEPYFLRGNSFVALGYYRPALDDYVKTIRLDPEFYGAYNNIAYIKIMNQGSSGNAHVRDVELAKQEISKILDKIDVDDKSVYFNMGIIHLRLGMYQKAVDFLKKSVMLDSGCSKCYYYLALAYFYEREYKLAKQNFSQSWKQGYNTRSVEDFIQYIAKVEDYLKTKMQQN